MHLSLSKHQSVRDNLSQPCVMPHKVPSTSIHAAVLVNLWCEASSLSELDVLDTSWCTSAPAFAH